MPWQLTHPPAKEEADTGLRFTDVLFGFVIRELFQRLTKWSQLSPVTKAHLVAGAVLVLGSWIGFRNSLNRREYNYRLRFVNLPLIRFIVDQAMLVMYFRFATATPLDPVSDRPRAGITGIDLVREDLLFLVLIFGLFVAWDLLSWVLARGKYTVLGKPYDRIRLVITLVSLGALAALRLLANGDIDLDASAYLWAATAVLFVYRVAKDARVAPTPAPPPSPTDAPK